MAAPPEPLRPVLVQPHGLAQTPRWSWAGAPQGGDGDEGSWSRGDDGGDNDGKDAAVVP